MRASEGPRFSEVVIYIAYFYCVLTTAVFSNETIPEVNSREK